MKKISETIKSRLTEIYNDSVVKKHYAKIYECAFRGVVRPDPTKSLDSLRELVQESERDTITFSVNMFEILIMDCLSQNMLEVEIKASLEDCTDSKQMIEDFVSFFSEFKARLAEPEDKTAKTTLNSSIEIPKIMDVEWKLLYNISSTYVYKLNKDLYIITLKVLDESNTLKTLEFKCSYEELQDLVSTLQHACKSIGTACQNAEGLLK